MKIYCVYILANKKIERYTEEEIISNIQFLTKFPMAKFLNQNFYNTPVIPDLIGNLLLLVGKDSGYFFFRSAPEKIPE